MAQEKVWCNSLLTIYIAKLSDEYQEGQLRLWKRTEAKWVIGGTERKDASFHQAIHSNNIIPCLWKCDLASVPRTKPVAGPNYKNLRAHKLQHPALNLAALQLLKLVASYFRGYLNNMGASQLPKPCPPKALANKEYDSFRPYLNPRLLLYHFQLARAVPIWNFLRKLWYEASEHLWGVRS